MGKISEAIDFDPEKFELISVYFGAEQISIKEVDENIIMESVLRFADEFDMDICLEWYMDEEYDFCFCISLIAGTSEDGDFAFINITYDEEDRAEDGVQTMLKDVKRRDYAGVEFFDIEDLLKKAAAAIKSSIA